jgi:hypothetical protein
MNDEFKLILQAALDKSNSEKRINTQVKEIREQIKDLEIGAQISDKDIKSAIGKVNKELQNTAKLNQNAFKLDSGVLQTYNDIGTYIRNNTNLTNGQVDQLNESQLATKKASDKSGLDRINPQFKTINSTAELMGRTGKSALNTLGDDIFKFAQWTISATALMSAINGVRTIVSNVYELDTAMTSLRKVTNETDTAYNKFLDNAAIKSQELATSLATYINQTAEWSKAGFNLIDSAKLAEVSTIFQNVGDVDAATSVADIVTPLKANLCLYI